MLLAWILMNIGRGYKPFVDECVQIKVFIHEALPQIWSPHFLFRKIIEKYLGKGFQMDSKCILEKKTNVFYFYFC